MRTDTVRNEVSSTVDHFDVLVVNTESIGANLRHHRFKALPQRRAARDELDCPGRIDGHTRAVRRANSTLFDKHCQANTHRLSLRSTGPKIRLECVPVQCCKGLV